MAKNFNNSKSTQHAARLRFFCAVKNHAPKVLDSLKKDVFQSFLSLINESNFVLNFSSEPYHLEAHGTKFAPQSSVEFELSILKAELHPYIRFQRAIIKWAEESNLIDAWCFYEALQTLSNWHRNGVSDNWAYAAEIKVGENSEQIFSFDFPAWEINSDTWASYKKQVEADFKESLLSYRNKIEQAARQNELIFIKNKQTVDESNFEWLVQFQINRLKVSEISLRNQLKGKKGVESSIHDAVHNTATILDLTLRSTKADAAT